MIVSKYSGEQMYDIIEKMKKDLGGRRVVIDHITTCYNPNVKKIEAIVIYTEKGWL